MTELPHHINEWIARQRWFGGKKHQPVLRSIGEWALPVTEAGVSIRTHLVYDSTLAAPTLYQLPLSTRASELSDGIEGLVHADAAGFVYDAPYDPAYAPALMRLLLAEGAGVGAGMMRARGEMLLGGAALQPLTVTASRVLRGEQSNTSIIIDTLDELGRAKPIICKVFRAVHPGENPDVAVQAALARAGSRWVPEPLGALVGDWADQAGRPATGHLAFAQEFLPGVEDAWRVALRSAEADSDFRTEARTLGRATADVHRDLAQAMPTLVATPELVEAAFAGMRHRFRLAEREVPALTEHGPAIDEVFARAQNTPWPRLQRIHGDYHLGQVLHSAVRGWVLVDFEGEPMRPLHERTRPDLPARDVAGMLRSFSYAAGTVAIMHPERAGIRARRWEMDCRREFLGGYAEQSGHDPAEQRALLTALELDKAIYEAVYETRNRPDWLPIPLAAIRALVVPPNSPNVRD